MTISPEVPQFGGKLYSTADGMIHMSILPNQRQPWPACHVGDEAPTDMIAWSGQATHPENPFCSDAITCPGCLRCLAADEIMAYQSLAAETHRDGVLPVDDGATPLHDEVTEAVFATPSGFMAQAADLSPEELATLKQRFTDAASSAEGWALRMANGVVPVNGIPDDGTILVGSSSTFLPQVHVPLAGLLEPPPDLPPSGLVENLARADFWAAMASSVNGIRDYENCERCDHDTHRCPGCGDPLTHGTEACAECNARIDEANALPAADVAQAVGPDWCHAHNLTCSEGQSYCRECVAEGTAITDISVDPDWQVEE